MHISTASRFVPLLFSSLAFVAGCKTEGEKQAQAARTELAQAQAAAKKAQEDLAAAEKKLAESAAKLGDQSATLAEQGAALGQHGAALGQRGAALGMEAAAVGLKAATAAMESLAGTANAAANRKLPPVDFRAVKQLLPDSIGKLKRTSATGEKSGTEGFTVSKVEGKYGADDGRDGRIQLEIVDLAGMGAVGVMAAGLAGLEIDKETEDGFERTTTINGRKALEKYDSRSKRGEVKLLVADRFVIEVDTDDLPSSALRETLAALDLGKLEALAAGKK